jgi:hypothetical protein
MPIRLSVRMEKSGSFRTDCHEILYLKPFKNSVEKIQVSLKSTRINDALHEVQYTLFITSRSFVLTTINVSEKICRENENTHFMLRIFFSKILPFMR